MTKFFDYIKICIKTLLFDSHKHGFWYTKIKEIKNKKKKITFSN